MSQSDFGNLVTTDPDGPTLGALLNAFRTALHSSHKGASRPSYAVTGTLWIEDDVTPWKLWLYDGVQDLLCGEIDATSHAFILPPRLMPAGTVRANITGAIAAAANVTLSSFLTWLGFAW